MYIKNLFDNYKQNVDPTSIQHDASNPAYSVWLNASAGTGKTKVLIDRVLRLLLSNVDISEILAITFTNAAAFEMKDRIMKTLQSWVLMSDSEIRDALNNLYGTEFDNKNDNEKQKEVIKAKSLFIKILDSPHGLRIETIHAFCQFILKKFPIESGINPNFSILTPHDADDILLNLYKNLIIKHGKKYSNIFDILLKYKDEETLFSAIKSIISVRKKFNKLFVKYDISIDDLDQKLIPLILKQYNIDKHIIFTNKYDELVKEYINHEKRCIIESFDSLQKLAKTILETSINNYKLAEIFGKTPIKQSEAVISFIDKYNNTLEFDIDEYLGLWTKNFLTKGLLEYIPFAKDILNKLKDNVQKISNNINKLKYLEFNYAIIKLAYIITEQYAFEKQKKSVLDYDDLIEKTLKLLTKSSDYSAWVLYKLDNNIKHILLDEAQDTSPEQWEIIDALSDGFFYSGHTNHDNKTLFVVGDRKQSIYSFQGANVDNFDLYHKKFKQKITENGFVFKDLNLDTSFRTSFPVLSVVNQMLSDKVISSGIVSYDEEGADFIHRVAEKNFDKPGFVELWPIVSNKSEKLDYNYWNPRQVVFESTLSKSILAKLIAKKIKILINDYKVKPGDIMILLNRRTDASILSHLVKKLIDEKIEIAGIDKLVLTDNIIICDLLALANICISEYDDLTLAGLLKSPFFEFNEEQVFDVCYDRNDKTVMDVLSEKYPDTYEKLKSIQNIALSGITPFEFFTFVLNKDGHLKKCYKRAGMETSDIIQEFLSLCLSFEQTPDHYLGLPGFISWITKDDISIQREVEKNPNKLRIMTIHGAKGLQSKIVFLPDTLSDFTSAPNEMKILFNEDDLSDLLPYIRPTNVDLIDEYKYIQEIHNRRQIEEKKRLLYVAMTRAEEALYICGYGSKNLTEDKLNKDNNYKNFYEILSHIISEISNIYEIDNVNDNIFDGIDCIGKNTILRITKYDNNKNILSVKDEEQIQEKNINGNNIIDDINPLYHNSEYSDDSIEIDKEIYSLNDSKQNINMLYGTLVHKLLEIIPIEYSRNEERSLSFVLKEYLKNISFLTQAQKNSLIEKLINSLRDDYIRNIILHKNSFNEISIFGNNKLYRIDKLIIDTDEKKILIIDYKTNTEAKNTSNKYIEQYKKQLFDYKVIIQNIYPEYKVQTAILWIADFSVSMFDL